MKLALRTIFLLFITAAAHSQIAPTILWTHSYGGPGYDNATVVHQTADGGYILAGSTNSFGHGDRDIFLIKTNSQGDTTWSRAYGGPSTDNGYSCIQTLDGGYIVVGSTLSFGPSGSANVYIVKTNSTGDTLWTRVIGGASSESANAVIADNSGNYLIVGEKNMTGSLAKNYYLIKLGSNGATLWERNYGGNRNEVAVDIHPTADGGYVLAGNSYVSQASTRDFYLLKINANGDSLWSRLYGGQSNDYCYSVDQTSDGGFILCGESNSYGNSTQMFVVRTEADGDSVWARNYGGSGNELATSVKAFADGSYILAGSTTTTGGGSEDVYLVRLSAIGDTLWTLRNGAAGVSERGYCIERTTDGGYIVAGQAATAGWDFYTLKTTSDFAGTVAGTIRSDRTNQVLVGAKVWATDWPDTVTSDLLGNYYLYAEPGTYTIHFAMETYCDSVVANIPVEDGNTTALNMRLKSPVANFGVTSINEIIEPGQNSSMTFMIHNVEGECPLDFSITDTSAWLSMNPNEGQIPPHQSQEITVNFAGNLLVLGNEYQSRMMIVHNAPGGVYPIPVLVFVASDADEAPATIPSEFKLYSNYPNPFNATTVFSFDIPKASKVNLTLYDIQGRSVQEILNGNYSAGHHRAIFSGDNLPSGMYFARMNADGFSAMQKIVLLK